VTELDAQLEDVKRQRDNAQRELSKAVGSHERTLKTRKDAGDDLERLLFPGRD
jgi:outer membrane protein TolC